MKNVTNYVTGLGFTEANLRVLMDDGRHEEPTAANIFKALDWIVSVSRPGDTVWFHYSGHGGRLRDQDGDEADGYDETLCPVDYQTAGKSMSSMVEVAATKILRVLFCFRRPDSRR